MKFGKTTTTIAVASAAALMLAACGTAEPVAGNPDPGTTDTTEAASVPRGGTLTLGIVQDIQSWDPSQAHVGHRLQPYQPVYDSLILREPDGTLAPMLATEWSYNDDNTVLSLDLRADVTFSDGAAFDAEAAKANLDHFKSANGPQAAMLTAVSEVTVVDEDTIEIALAEPDPALEYYLSQAAGLMGSPEHSAPRASRSCPSAPART